MERVFFQVLLFCCCCRKHDLIEMVDEAVEDFHHLPKVVMPNGSEVPVTADVDIHTISLQPFNHFIMSDQYYEGIS